MANIIYTTLDQTLEGDGVTLWDVIWVNVVILQLNMDNR